MKASELRNLSAEELTAKLKELKATFQPPFSARYKPVGQSDKN